MKSKKIDRRPMKVELEKFNTIKWKWKQYNKPYQISN